MSQSFDPTHTLLVGEYPAALDAVLAVTLPRVDEAFVRLHEDEIADETFDPAEMPRRVWNDVHDDFRLVDGPGPFENPTDADTVYRLAGNLSAYRDLSGVVENAVVGRHFLHELAATIGERRVLQGFPHHQDLSVDADALGGRDYLRTAADGLDGVAACLVPAGTRLEWCAEGRTYSVAGGSLCVDRDGRLGERTTCWGLAGVEAVQVDGTTLVLDWITDDRAAPIRLLSGAVRAAAGATRPDAVPCGDRRTARQVRDTVAETLTAFDGRQVADGGGSP